MRLGSAVARERFIREPVARLASVDADGQPHLVPLVFAVSGDILYSAVDPKPKSTTALKRLANIAANPRVCLLVDHYEDDWTRIWWARADGTARVVGVGESGPALELLAVRYADYVAKSPPGPVIVVDVARWSGWSAAG